MAEVAERYLGQGFAALKIRFHRGDWRDDIKALEAVRAQVGDRLELMVDCNQGWRMPWDTERALDVSRTPLAVAARARRLGVYWMEEPLHRGDYDGMRRLREARRQDRGRGDDPRADEFRELITAAASTCSSPTWRFVGGITGLRRVASWRRSTTWLTPHTWTNGMGVVGKRASDRRFGRRAVAGVSLRSSRMGPRPARLRRARAASVEQGGTVLGEAPGMGYAPDEESLARTRTG